jgi:uncharacterized protein YlxW (UPF0749 family)
MSAQRRADSDAAAPRRPDASMTLLREVMERPVDPGYAEVAARRTSPVRRSAATRTWIALLAVLLGAATTVAVVQLRRPQPAVLEARSLLERQIAREQEAVAGLTAQAGDLTATIDALQRSALTSEDQSLLDTIRLDGLHNGTLPVSGPGLVISLTNGAAASGADRDPSALVRDQDLQRVVNSLWAAGAEAISIDDQRLTDRTAIRNAGAAVLVNLNPLAGPTYVVRAVGDAAAMQAALARSFLPGYLELLASSYGIRSSVVAQSALDLPGVNVQPLQYAHALGSAP